MPGRRLSRSSRLPRLLYCLCKFPCKLTPAPVCQEASDFHLHAGCLDNDQAAVRLWRLDPERTQVQPVRAGLLGLDQFYQKGVFSQNDTFAICRMAPVMKKSQTYRRQFKNRKAEDVPGTAQGK